MKYKKTLTLISVFLFCFAWFSSPSKTSRDLKPNESTDLENYRVEISGKGYCIPRAYYRWSNSFNKTDDIGINLSLEITSLEAWSLYRKKNKDNPINISNEREIGLIVLDQTLSSRQERWKTLLKPSLKSTTTDGYYRYDGTKNPLVNLDYYLTPQKQADFSWVLGCVSGARCSLESQLDDRTFFEISFDERYLDQIKALENRVRNFLKNKSCNN